MNKKQKLLRLVKELEEYADLEIRCSNCHRTYLAVCGDIGIYNNEVLCSDCANDWAQNIEEEQYNERRGCSVFMLEALQIIVDQQVQDVVDRWSDTLDEYKGLDIVDVLDIEMVAEAEGPALYVNYQAITDQRDSGLNVIAEMGPSVGEWLYIELQDQGKSITGLNIYIDDVEIETRGPYTNGY